MGNLWTGSGYQLSDCVSAMQKCIRRGEEELAMFFAREIETKYPGYLWVRLITIANEDIGLASPDVLVLVESLRQQYEYLRTSSKSPSERIVLANAVLALCRAKKTRLADDFQCVIYRRATQEAWKPEIPEFAYDRHTAKGKQMGRGWEHFETEATKLANEVPGMNPYAKDAHALRQKHGKLPPKVMPRKGVAADLIDDTPDQAQLL